MISKTKWAEIIKDFHEKALPTLINRNLNIPQEIPIRRAISIIGPRRAGKTYSMYQLITSILKNDINIKQIFYVNFEKNELDGASIEDLSAMIETYYELYPENKDKKVWLFLDEIQNITKWEKFVRTLIDSNNVQVFVSGSSSKLLSREIATAMRGRALTYTILPFSFSEYLSAANIKLVKYFSSAEKANIAKKLANYLHNGGYPEVVLYPQEKERLLQEIVEITIYRDVVERNKIRNTKLLKLLIMALINSTAREFSIHKFWNFVKSAGVKVSKNTLYAYVNALNDVFFVFTLRKFSYSYKDSEQSMPKIYIIDNGILTNNGISDNGRLIENLVFIELRRQEKAVYYYKSADGKEVDFIILKNNKVIELLQVSYSLEDIKTKEREISALLKASKELKCNNLKIITYDTEKTEVAKGKKITYMPLWKWLLEKR